MKKNRQSATANIYQKKSWEEYLEKTKYSQSCIYIEISALLVRLIVNIMEEIEKKSVKHNQRRLPGVIVL